MSEENKEVTIGKTDIVLVIYEENIDGRNVRKYKVYYGGDKILKNILEYKCESEKQIFLPCYNEQNCKVVSVTMLKNNDEERICIGHVDDISVFILKNESGKLVEIHKNKNYDNIFLSIGRIFPI